MLIGKEFGPYIVDKELGSGAMGTVFRAKHQKNRSRVAIKLMSLALGSNEAALNRFKREVEILKQLDHPNIVKYIGSGRYHGSPFYIMEYVEGESLDRILARRGRLPWEEVVALGIDLCAALQHAHDKGIIHRDLKPSNLMILKSNAVKLTDFGIAKDQDVTALTAANSTVGTAAYMSPEQCRGSRDISHKTDLYSMGIMFYELLTGKKPFIGVTAMEVFLQHANKTDYRTPGQIVLDVPIWLDTLVSQLMEKEPTKRPLHASAVADSLRLIKEKIEVQRSAGVETATKKRGDRTGADRKLDEEDKDAARTILGKKKKLKPQPFYAKGWFTVLALGVLALASVIGIYYAFIKVPSAESLYCQAAALRQTDAKTARDEPITLFLKYYPQHEKAEQVRKWADEYDFETLNRQMHNRLARKMPADGAEEQAFRAALADEDQGKLDDAMKRWQSLAAKKESDNTETHAWGLLGDHYTKELKKVSETYAAIEKRVKRELAEKKESKEDDKFAQIATDAVRAELTQDNARATRKWEELKKTTDETSERRLWFLLATSRLREINAKQ